MRGASRWTGHAWPRDRRGISALEFGLIAPVMILFIQGAVDVGNAVQQNIQLRQAVYQGGLYARAKPTDDPTIISTISGAIPSSWHANTPTVGAVACTCVTVATGASASNDCVAPCPSTAILTRSRTLNVTMSYSALLFTNISTLSASYVVRYQ
jgi:Flp pilus assembly protein TadG